MKVRVKMQDVKAGDVFPGGGHAAQDVGQPLPPYDRVLIVLNDAEGKYIGIVAEAPWNEIEVERPS